MKNIWRLFISFLIIKVVVVIASTSDSESSTSPGLNFEDYRVGNYSSDDEASNYNGDTELDEAFEELKLTGKSANKSNFKAGPTSDAPTSHRPLACIDGNGTEVDWWFVYKEPNGKRYLYYSSIDAKEGRKSFLPLNYKFLIDDPKTSPVIKTIYHPGNVDPSEVWMGWNDQPDNDDEESTTKKSSPTDGYGTKVCGIKHAHSKGFYAQNYVQSSTNPRSATVGSYVMMTSLPRFPRLESMSPANFGGALNNQLPSNASKIFNSNLSAKAQHFFCMSLAQEEIEIDSNKEAKVDFKLGHVQFLHKYLKTIHPAIMGTNFTDQNIRHQIWRRYFSLLSMPYSRALNYIYHSDINVQLKAYETSNLPSLRYTRSSPVENDYLHVFPLTSCRFYCSSNGYYYYSSQRTFTHRWEAQYSKQNGCQTGTEQCCVASLSVKTTDKQSELELHFFAKNGATILDLWDDWASLQLFEAQQALPYNYAGEVIDRYGLLVQSWTDSRTELPRKTDKKIFNDQHWLGATVHIDNVSHLWMPVKRSSALRVSSKGTDHSKWALGYALDTFNSRKLRDLKNMNYSFVPQVFIGDLNRTTTQACLKDKGHGRGGGVVTVSDPFLWRALLELHPRAPRQKFITSGKLKIKRLQKDLHKHTVRFSTRPLPLGKARSTVFKSLRLSKREAKTQKKALPFVPMLSELSVFIKKAENKPEHAAAYAFQLLFENFAHGKVEGTAEAVWKNTEKEIKILEMDEDYAVLATETWPKLFEIPSIYVHREVPTSSFTDYSTRWYDLIEQTPHIIRNPDATLSSLPEHEFNPDSMKPVSVETQTDFVDGIVNSASDSQNHKIQPVSQEKADGLFGILSNMEALSLDQQKKPQHIPSLVSTNSEDDDEDDEEDEDEDDEDEDDEDEEDEEDEDDSINYESDSDK